MSTPDPAQPIQLSATLLAHLQHPCGLARPRGHHAHARITGPCGDTMEFWLTISGNVITQAHFATDGCWSTIVCGSAACRLAQGRTLRQAQDISQRRILTALGGLPAAVRHCALLASTTLRSACRSYRPADVTTYL